MHLLFLLLLGPHEDSKQSGHLVQFPVEGLDLLFQLPVRAAKAGLEVAHDHLHLERKKTEVKVVTLGLACLLWSFEARRQKDKSPF